MPTQDTPPHLESRSEVTKIDCFEFFGSASFPPLARHRFLAATHVFTFDTALYLGGEGGRLRYTEMTALEAVMTP
jgi:hypothetical protein